MWKKMGAAVISGWPIKVQELSERNKSELFLLFDKIWTGKKIYRSDSTACLPNYLDTVTDKLVIANNIHQQTTVLIQHLT